MKRTVMRKGDQMELTMVTSVFKKWPSSTLYISVVVTLSFVVQLIDLVIG